jgi:hypothetical protein
MEITKESVEDLLNNLIRPMFDGIVEIEVEKLSLFDDPSLTDLYPVINVTFDKEIHSTYEDTNELEYKLTKEVQSVLKYFSIYNSIVDVFVISDI